MRVQCTSWPAKATSTVLPLCDTTSSSKYCRDELATLFAACAARCGLSWGCRTLSASDCALRSRSHLPPYTGKPQALYTRTSGLKPSSYSRPTLWRSLGRLTLTLPHSGHLAQPFLSATNLSAKTNTPGLVPSTSPQIRKPRFTRIRCVLLLRFQHLPWNTMSIQSASSCLNWP